MVASEAKFRAVCAWCGAKQPRATTAYTVGLWMRRHAEEHATAGSTDG